MSKKVTYSQNGRGGTIKYEDGETVIPLDWEFGGGNCVVIIFVPTEMQWEKATGLPLSERSNILEFVAQQVIHDQAPNSRYEISDPWIEIFSR
ncbi:MAG: hypothetical protein ACK4TA_11465 [Saprospiraceae bacterium]